jgi:hypothetical protein
MILQSHIICYSTPNYAQLTQLFMNSLMKLGVQKEQVIYKLDIPDEELIKKGTGYNTDLWHYCVLNKIKHLIDTLKESRVKQRKYFIFSDCDIHFLVKNKIMWTQLDKHCMSTNKDIYFMREGNGKEVNTGFFIIKNNQNLPHIIHFFEMVYETMQLTPREQMKFGDQTIINNIKQKINYGTIPNEYVIWGTTIFNKQKALFHHAVNCKDVVDKVEQIKEMYIKAMSISNYTAPVIRLHF